VPFAFCRVKPAHSQQHCAPPSACAARPPLGRQVLPCLESSLGDYTTDNRGDVGSWVREAAMAVMPPALAAVARCGGEEALGSASDDSCALGAWAGRPARQSARHWVAAPARLTRVPKAAVRPVAAYPAGPAARCVAALLRQAVERIGRVREAALAQLGVLLGEPRVAAHVPAAAAVAEAVVASAALAAGGGAAASLEALSQLVARLLAVRPYGPALLEGLVASLGCVDASLSRAAAAALVDTLAAAATATERGGEGEAEPRAACGLLVAVAGDLMDVWARHARSGRLAGPLLRTAALLLARAPGAGPDGVAELRLPRPPPEQAAGPGAAAAGGGSRFGDHLAEAARAETRGCADVARLCEAAGLLAALVPTPGHCRRSSLQGLLVLLASRYPKVRVRTRACRASSALAVRRTAAHPILHSSGTVRHVVSPKTEGCA
jgi:hypothetical protein